MPNTPPRGGSSIREDVPSSEEYGTFDTEENGWLAGLINLAESSRGLDGLGEENWLSDSTYAPYETPLSSQPRSRRRSDVVLSQETEHITFPQFKGKKRLATEGDSEPAQPKASRLADTVLVSHHEALGSRSSSTTASSTAYTTPSRTPDAYPVADTAQTSFESKNGGHSGENRGASKKDPSSIVEKSPPLRSILGPEGDANLGKVEFDVGAYLNKNVKSRTPFPALPMIAQEFSFRVCYEVTRVALHTSVPEKDIFQELKGRRLFEVDGYGVFRSTLANFIHMRWKQGGPKTMIKPSLPERCSEEAWAKSKTFLEHVDLSAQLTISKARDDRLFNFKLKPFKLSRSNRTTRKYGSDRLLSIDIPHIEPHELPEVLKPYSGQVAEFVIAWLLSNRHSILGRIWAAWFVKPIERSRGSKSPEIEDSLRFGNRLYFIALSGNLHSVEGPSASSRNSLESIAKFLDWALILDANKSQPIPKLFSRLQLVLSATLSTDAFSQLQILRRDNAYSTSPGEWKLDVTRSNEKKRNIHKPLAKPKGSIMNDGCARMSRKAAQYIVQMLGLDYIPCAFQGRIAGAKGMWMIAAREESLKGLNFGAWNNSDRNTDPKVWIELTDEQVKFETIRPRQTHDPNPDPSKMSFEVLDYVKPLSMSYLNFQVLSVLLANGVPLAVFEKLLAEDLTDKAEKMKNAMRDPASLAQYLLRQYPVRSQRVASNGIEMQGGLPFDLVERILYLLYAGFSPLESRLLRQLCSKQINLRNQRLIDKMSIGVGRSTRAFILPDPMDVLEEGECFLYFSSTFEDFNTGEKIVSLHERDVLVARSPVLERSDVQKVRAIFKPELEPYKDVVIFSCRGDVSLAHRLSGGDFDGDKVWICWEPEIVSNFRNYPLPLPENSLDLGMEKRKRSLADHLPRETDDPANSKSAVHIFLQEGITLNMRPSLLPTVNAYYDKYVYKYGYDGKAPQLAALCAALLDASKAGIDFTRANWNDFQQRNGFRRDLVRPAYKTQEEQRLASSRHPIDKLVYGARNLVIGLKLKFEAEFKPEDVAANDQDLTSLINAEEKTCKWEGGLKAVLDQLHKDLKELYEDWKKKVAPSPTKPWSEHEFRIYCDHARTKFLQIRPLTDTDSVTARRWKNECDPKCQLSTKGSWVLLKASALFRITSSGNCAWWVCGHELCQIKATRNGDIVTVLRRLFELSSVDTRLVERIKLKERLLETKDGEFEDAQILDSDDEFGASDWVTPAEAFGAGEA